jgi:hypothetical protein
MFTSIGQKSGRLEKIRMAIRQSPLVALRELLTDQDVLNACKLCGHQYRERLYGPVVTVFHYIAQAIQREHSFRATWQELWTPVLSKYPELDLGGSNHSGLCHARKRLPGEILHILAKQFCRKTRSLKYSKWKGYRLLALDGTTVSMPRTEELFKHFGAHRARTTTVRYPLGTLGTLLCVGTSLILDYRFGPFDPGEDATCRPLYSNLSKDDLLLADRGFAGSPSLARIKNEGADFLMRKNARLIVSNLPVIQKLGRDDFITEIPMDKRAKKKDPGLPEKVRVRIFKVSWKTPAGEVITDWFVTSLEDPRRFKKRTLANLYHLRWQIETSYLEFKQLFHADVLRSKTVENIYKEFDAHIIAYQLTRLIIHAAAQKHDLQPNRISFVNAARWIVSFSHQMAAAPARNLPLMYHSLLDAVGCMEIDVRPGRLEPRALTREWKNYPHLRMSRTEWRKQRLNLRA